MMERKDEEKRDDGIKLPEPDRIDGGVCLN